MRREEETISENATSCWCAFDPWMLMEKFASRSYLGYFSFFTSASLDWGSAEHGCQQCLRSSFIGEDWLVLLTRHFPRVNGSFWLCSSVVGGELSPVRLPNGYNPRRCLGNIPRRVPMSFALCVRKIKCQEKRVQFRSIWSGLLLSLPILHERELFKETLWSL